MQTSKLVELLRLVAAPFRDDGYVHVRADKVRQAADRLEQQSEQLARAIPMVLHCPRCGAQHIDEPKGAWTNPPHRSHECQGCGLNWRPADVPTVGVRTVETVGKADNPKSDWAPLDMLSRLEQQAEQLARVERLAKDLGAERTAHRSPYNPTEKRTLALCAIWIAKALRAGRDERNDDD